MGTGVRDITGVRGHDRGKPWSLDKSGTYHDTVRGPPRAVEERHPLRVSLSCKLRRLTEPDFPIIKER